jgi:invasion protein IalB
MKVGPVSSANGIELSLNSAAAGFFQRCLLLGAILLLSLGASGCAGLVSGNSSTTPTPTLQITNVQVTSTTTSSCQIAWTTNIPADSTVAYGTTSSYGSSTNLDSTMVTTHQVTVSALGAGTTYYYEVLSTDASKNHGKSGGHSFKTAGFAISGSLSPATGGSGATLTLTGAASATATADTSGNYAFSGLPNGSYGVGASHAGYTFSPSTQSVTVNGANVAGVNFTDSAQTFTISGTISPAGGASGATLTLTGAANATTTANASGAYVFTGVVSGSYTITPSNSGYSFTPASQNVTVNAANVTGVNFTDTLSAVAPTITTQPVSRAVTAGQTATFSVVASGTAPFSYQWQKNGVNISGATASNYTTPATTTSDSGSSFDVVVSNAAGTVTSSAVTLTVNAAPVAPTITTQPVSQMVTAGQTATFTVVASGTAPLTYQWQKNGANISGAIASSYTTPATTTSDSGSTFHVTISNTAGTVTSSAVTLTVNAAPVAPTITTQPVSQTVTAGQTATFTVVASGNAPLNYQWQKNGTNISGATTTSYTTPATTTSDSGSSFDVMVSNTAGTVTSATATLTVNPAPAPAIQVNPTAISLGNVVVGISTSQALIIKNTGTASLSVSQVTANGSGFSVSGFTLPLNVSAGQQTTITVAFLPIAAGTVSGNVSIVSNAPTSPTSVSLTGTGIAATLTLGISPASLNFGNVTTGTASATQNVVISDTGNSNVTISQITLSGTGYFMTGGGTPVTLSPSQNITLSVQFSPTATGTDNASISIVSNATGSPASVSLTGAGVAPIQHSVALSWNASPSAVVGYNVYRSTVSGSLFAKINTSLVAGLVYTDASVQSGITYYYVATALDASGNESVFSNQVQATVP